MHFEQHELHGNLMKGFLHGTLGAVRARWEVPRDPPKNPWFEFRSSRATVTLSGSAVAQVLSRLN